MLTFYFHRSLTLRGRRWYWRLKAQNGRIIADSGEGYVNFKDAQDAVFLIQREAAQANSDAPLQDSGDVR